MVTACDGEAQAGAESSYLELQMEGWLVAFETSKPAPVTYFL